MERYKVISGIRILFDAQGLTLLACHKWTATKMLAVGYLFKCPKEN